MKDFISENQSWHSRCEHHHLILLAFVRLGFVWNLSICIMMACADWTLRNKCQWDLNQKVTLFVLISTFEYVLHKMTTSLCPCVNFAFFYTYSGQILNDLLRILTNPITDSHWLRRWRSVCIWWCYNTRMILQSKTSSKGCYHVSYPECNLATMCIVSYTRRLKTN